MPDPFIKWSESRPADGQSIALRMPDGSIAAGWYFTDAIDGLFQMSDGEYMEIEEYAGSTKWRPDGE